MSCLTLIGAVPLGQAASQFWKPEVAHAAKVTVQLFQNKSLNPLRLARRNQAARVTQPTSGLPKAQSELFISYTLAQPLPVGYPASTIKAVPSATLTTASQSALTTISPVAHDLLFMERSLAPQTGHTPLEKSLKEQRYQIKKLELSLAKEQLQDGKISQSTFNQKATDYQIAQPEVKPFLDSSKMTD
ncbi:MAG: hypothetical protein NW220_17945 [Leptolyngbyaceae cyanobacterium bins.349]|nr:hypothetical protein [Leptolyngbyaceae cyanobacterium bins.349]